MFVIQLFAVRNNKSCYKCAKRTLSFSVRLWLSCHCCYVFTSSFYVHLCFKVDNKIYLCRGDNKLMEDVRSMSQQQRTPVCLVSMVECHKLIGIFCVFYFGLLFLQFEYLLVVHICSVEM